MRYRDVFSCVCLTGCVLFGAMAYGQPALPPSTTFKVQSHLVLETVTVKDKKGNSVPGLSASDFRVTEDGVPQTIRQFEYEDLAAPSQAAQAGLSPTAGPIAQTATPDHVYRNRRLLVLYFDMSSMPPADQLRAAAAAQRFIRSQMSPSDMIAVLQYGGSSVQVVQDFTSDRDELLNAIGHLLVGEGQGFESDATARSQSSPGAAFGQDDAEFNIFNTDRQLAALQTAIKMFAGVNEKKALVYFAGGVRLNGLDNQAQLRATLNSAVRSNVAIFSVDARGLTAMPPAGDASHRPSGGLAMYSGTAATALATAFQRSQDALYTLAADTGGKTLLNWNDLAAGITQAQKALSDYYLIGYYSTNTALDGKFRRVDVSSKELSATLDYRRGYYANKEFRKFTAADRERQLEEAFMLEDPVTDLPIALEVNYFRLNRAEYYVPVTLKIPGSELELARRGGAARMVLDFIGEIKGSYGNTVQNLRDGIEIKVPDRTAPDLAHNPIEYDAGFTMLPGAYTIKFLVRDRETGRIGTYQSQFVIPNLDKEAGQLPISSVVLSGQWVDLRDALFTAGKDKEQAGNPMVQDGKKLIPSVTRVFSRSCELHVYMQAYELLPGMAHPVTAFVSLYRGQAEAFETAPLEVSGGLRDKQTVPLVFNLRLGELPTGKYEIQVSVIDRVARKVAFWQAPILVTR